MEIISNKEEMVFRKDYNGKPSYSLGLSKKDKDGKYINGYVKVNFKKGVELDNKSKIKIKNAWLDFYKDNEKTIPTIFINEFEIIDEPAKKVANSCKKVANSCKKDETNPFEEFGQQIEIDMKNDLPF